MSIILLVIQRDSEYYVVSELSKGYTQENNLFLFMGIFSER